MEIKLYHFFAIEQMIHLFFAWIFRFCVNNLVGFHNSFHLFFCHVVMTFLFPNGKQCVQNESVWFLCFRSTKPYN